MNLLYKQQQPPLLPVPRVLTLVCTKLISFSLMEIYFSGIHKFEGDKKFFNRIIANYRYPFDEQERDRGLYL